MEILIEFMKTAPYVAIIIWYTLSLRRSEREERTLRDQEWREFLTGQMSGTLRALDEVSTNLKQLAEQVRKMDVRVALIHDMIDDHDRHAERVAIAVDAMVAQNSNTPSPPTCMARTTTATAPSAASSWT